MASSRDTSRYYIIIYGVSVSLLLLYMLFSFLNVIVYAVFIYYVTRPIKNRINRKIASEDYSILISLLLLVLPVILIALYSLSVASYELTILLTEHTIIPQEYIDNLLEELQKIYLNLKITDIPELIKGGLDSITKRIIAPLINIIDVLFKLFITFLTAFYLLRYDAELRTWFTKLIPSWRKEAVVKFIDSVDNSLRNIFFGNLLTIIATSVIGVLFFHLYNMFSPPEMQVPYPLLFGVLCGLGTLVPAIGVKAVWIPLFIYISAQAYLSDILMTEWPYLIVFLFAVNVFIDFTPDLLLRPLVSGKDIHKGALMLIYIFGPAVFGLMGIFLGPILFILIINFSKIILPELTGNG